MATTHHLDLALINGYLEALSIDVLKQMLDLYIQQSQVYLSEIETAITLADQTMWQEQCHKMKGSAASAGLSQVHQDLVDIEKSTEDWSIKSTRLKMLIVLNQQAIDAFQQWLLTQ
jgi:HPt (histidine-containing phosphotransfer) domain-containing protein